MNLINIIIIFLAVILLFLLSRFIFTQKEDFITEIPYSLHESIDPTTCEDNLMNFDEINLNEIKKIHSDTIFEEEKPRHKFLNKKIDYVNTYMELPGYKSYNIVDLNKFELKDNNRGLINYVILKKDEAFKASNSLIYQ